MFKSLKGSLVSDSPTQEKSIGKCSREIVHFLAKFPEREFSKAQVAIATGYSVGSGGFNNSLSQLNQVEWILRSGKLRINEEVMEDIIAAIGKITPQAYSIETYRDKPGKCEAEIYDILLRHQVRAFQKMKSQT